MLCVTTVAWGQKEEGKTGYKGFAWGTPLEEVKAKVEQMFRATEYGSIHPNSESWEPSHILDTSLAYAAIAQTIAPDADLGLITDTCFRGDWADSDSGLFAFYEGKLVSVVLWSLFDNGVQRELITMYGQGKLVEVDRGYGSYPCRVWTSGDRYIVLYRSSERIVTEAVMYVDAAWIKRVCAERLDILHKRQQRSKSLLD
jgi:hypothetical protein